MSRHINCNGSPQLVQSSAYTVQSTRARTHRTTSANCNIVSPRSHFAFNYFMLLFAYFHSSAIFFFAERMEIYSVLPWWIVCKWCVVNDLWLVHKLVIQFNAFIYLRRCVNVSQMKIKTNKKLFTALWLCRRMKRRKNIDFVPSAELMCKEQ